MGKVFIERRDLSPGVALTWDMALHLYTRNLKGAVVIVSENPAVLMPALRKQWLKVIRRLTAEMASTLNLRRRREIAINIQRMEELQFVVNGKDAYSESIVLFVTPLDLSNVKPGWHTCYVVLPQRDELIIASLPKFVQRHGLIVDYAIE